MDTILIFRFAKLYNFYFNPIVAALRFGILGFVVAMLLFSLQQGVSVRFPIGLLLLFSMTELFFRIKFATLKPEKTLDKATPVELLSTFTLPSAALLLKVGNSPFVKALSQKKEVQFVLKRANIKKGELVQENVDRNELAILAATLASEEEKSYVTVLDIFAAYLLLTEKKTKLLFKKELKKEDLLTIVAWAQSIFPQELTISFPKVELWGEGIGEAMISGWTLETQKYTRNFTRKALADGANAPGRERELSLLIESLSKSKQSNALLIGEPGVGKRDIVASFAVRSFLGDVPGNLRYLRVLELLSGMLVAGAPTSGEFEERLANILREVIHASDVVIFIPDLETIAGAGSDKLDVTGVLLPHLLEDNIHIIATVTPQNFKTYIEKKAAFVDAFDKITISEPTQEEAIPMLLDESLLLEHVHRVTFSYKAIVAAVVLSRKYVPASRLPGKAIALLDEVGAKAKASGKKVIEKADIESLIETKVPVKVIAAGKDEKHLLLNLEDILHKRIIDQEEAVTAVSEAMRRLRSGLALEGRPTGVFLFLGPTGVGKTETAKALASVYFGSEDKMIRFDMSEYQAPGSADRLIDTLSEKVREHPFSLLLLDEFEKAYPSLLDVFLSVFEDGRLTDSSGKTVSFENTIIIATSNAGSEFIREQIAQGVDLATVKPELLDKLQKEGQFKPELINRFDAIILFKPLGAKEVEAVTTLLLQKVAGTLMRKDITFQFDESAVGKIAKEGFDQTMGARPLRRYIADHVEDLLSKKLLGDEIKRGDTVTLSCDESGNLTLAIA